MVREDAHYVLEGPLLVLQQLDHPDDQLPLLELVVVDEEKVEDEFDVFIVEGRHIFEQVLHDRPRLQQRQNRHVLHAQVHRTKELKAARRFAGQRQQHRRSKRVLRRPNTFRQAVIVVFEESDRVVLVWIREQRNLRRKHVVSLDIEVLRDLFLELLELFIIQIRLPNLRENIERGTLWIEHLFLFNDQLVQELNNF